MQCSNITISNTNIVPWKKCNLIPYLSIYWKKQWWNGRFSEALLRGLGRSHMTAVYRLATVTKIWNKVIFLPVCTWVAQRCQNTQTNSTSTSIGGQLQISYLLIWLYCWACVKVPRSQSFLRLTPRHLRQETVLDILTNLRRIFIQATLGYR